MAKEVDGNFVHFGIAETHAAHIIRCVPGVLAFTSGLTLCPAKKGYEDVPTPDGARISAHFNAEPLAASADTRKSKKSNAKNCF